MAETTIEWTWRRLKSGLLIIGYTFNIVWGCVKVSEGCKGCYAETLSNRYGFALWGPRAERRTFGEAYWQKPLKWNAQAEKQGYRRNVFCSSMADTFEDHPIVNQEREKLWPLIEQTPWLNWLLLTKRPQNIMSMVPWQGAFPENVWVGTSVENQRRADERVPILLQVPAQIHFLSCEPLLEQVDLSAWIADVQWVIAGAESGPKARPMDENWVRCLRDQCQSAQVAFLYKQNAIGGRKIPLPALDGKVWQQFPDMAEAVSR